MGMPTRRDTRSPIATAFQDARKMLRRTNFKKMFRYRLWNNRSNIEFEPFFGGVTKASIVSAIEEVSFEL